MNEFPLSKEQRENIIRLVTNLAHFNEAAEFVGVSAKVASRCRALGEEFEKRGENNEFTLFSSAVRKALASRSIAAKARMVRLSENSVTAADRVMQIADPTTIPQVKVHVTNELEAALVRLEDAFAGDENETLTKGAAFELARLAVIGDYRPPSLARTTPPPIGASGLHSEAQPDVQITSASEPAD